MTALPPGTLVAGRFRVLRTLGSGGQAEVLLAHDSILPSRQVALKVAHDMAADARVRREGDVLSKITSGRVVRLLDRSELSDGRACLVLEALGGLNLRQALKSGGKLETRRALRLGVQIARALAEIHAHGLVHGDLKPANIQLCKTRIDGERAVLLDLGCAKPIDAQGDLTPVNHQAGTPAYASPETFTTPVGCEGDVYALGMVIYEMVTGVHPFAGRSPATPPSSETPNPASPPMLDAAPEVNGVISRCLSVQPSDRPSALALATELDALLAGADSRQRFEVSSLGIRSYALIAAASLVVSASVWLAVEAVLADRFVPAFSAQTVSSRRVAATRQRTDDVDGREAAGTQYRGEANMELR